LQFATTRLADPANYNLVISPTTQKSSYFAVVHAGIALALGYLHHLIVRSDHMADVIFIVVTVIFFIISWLYVIGCDRL
jgi:hypothetical protein